MLTRLQWIIVVVLGAAAVVLNVGNLWLGATLKDELTSRQAAAGMLLRAMPVFNLDSPNPGETATESFKADRPQLLFLISPTCGYCRENLIHWQEIEKRLNPEQIRLLALTKQNGPDNALYQDALSTPILLSADRQALRANHLVTTPQTLLLDADGRVLRNWIGVLDEERPEIERHLASVALERKNDQ